MIHVAAEQRTALSAGLALVALLALAAPAAAQLSDFTWTLGGDPGGSGTVDATSMHIVGPDDGTVDGEPPGVTHFTTVAALAGTVSCTYAFDNQDIGFSFWHFEHPVYMLDGVKVPIGDPSTSFDEIFEVSFHVEAGQSFGFGIHSVDCLYGPGVADITDFVFAKDPGTWTDLGHSLRATVDFTSDDSVPGPASASGADLVVCGCGDMNADGVPDLAEGRPLDGHVRVLSGADFSLIREWTRPGLFGASLAAAGDFEQDGYADLLVGAPGDTTGGADAGRAYVLSGITGDELRVVTGVTGDRLGTSVAGGVMPDSAEWPDFLVGLPRDPGVDGRANLYRGSDGTLKASFKPPIGQIGDDFGAAVASTDPASGGHGDAVVGDPSWNLGRGRAYVFSALTGGLKHTLSGLSIGAQFGAAVAGAGDLDGNGMDDFFVGAPGDDASGAAAGSVSVYLMQSFSTAELLAVHVGDAPGEGFGAALAGGRDVDLDGGPDLVVGAAQDGGGGGRVVVLNALDGTVHADLAGAPGQALGASVALVGAIDGNAASAVAASAPQPGAGTTRVLHDVVGTPGPPHLTGIGTQFNGAPTTLRVTKGKPSSSLWLIVGLTPLELPFKGGVLVPDPDLVLPFVADGSGKLLLQFVWPSGLPPSFELRFQAWIVDPQGVAGLSATNGLLSQGPPVP